MIWNLDHVITWQMYCIGLLTTEWMRRVYWSITGPSFQEYVITLTGCSVSTPRQPRQPRPPIILKHDVCEWGDGLEWLRGSQRLKKAHYAYMVGKFPNSVHSFLSSSSHSSLEQSSAICDIFTVADSFSAASQDGTVYPSICLKLVMTFL